jgi:hypothetical protein
VLAKLSVSRRSPFQSRTTLQWRCSSRPECRSNGRAKRRDAHMSLSRSKLNEEEARKLSKGDRVHLSELGLLSSFSRPRKKGYDRRTDAVSE